MHEKIGRAKRIWPLHAVCMTAIAVSIYITTMILCRRYDLIAY
jgi:peptidoglycan/LPS O-acetylase OafA/YrhL